MTFTPRYALGNFWKRLGRSDVARGTPTQPAAPTGLGSSAITDTTVTLTWTLSTSPGVTAQRVYLNNSRYTAADPIGPTATSVVISGLTANTSYTWKVTAYNGTTALNSAFSTAYSMTTTGAGPSNSPNVPNSVTAVKSPTFPQTQINIAWTAPTVDGTHDAATGYRVYKDGVQQSTDLSAGITALTIAVDPGSTSLITVKAFNASGESPPSTAISVTTDSVPTTTVMLMGCSASNNDHGGTEVWDGWRVYQESPMLNLANRTGSERPLFLAYSKDGPNLGSPTNNTFSSYTSVYNEVLADLNDFYYTTSTGQTHTARWGIKLYWSNGNENHDKGALATHNATQIGWFVESQRALYDAVHFIDPTTGQRRFPDAFAGSNPTHNAEQQGEVAAWLHPSARYHDFVMWSMYPPGREQTSADPTFSYPSFTESQRTVNPHGFLIRCFYRTKQAEAQARIDTGNPNLKMSIGCGEVGIGNDPDDNTTRPYYAVHGLARAMYVLSNQYDLPMPFACWWDNQSSSSSSQNILQSGFGAQNWSSTLLLGEPAATNPSTREAWQNWTDYCHLSPFNGTHPASWAGNPKTGTWKTSGTVV